MDLSERVGVVGSTLTPEDEEYPSYRADDIGLLFGDIATPTGFVLNRRDLRVCYVDLLNLDIFQRFKNFLRTPHGWADICI